MIAKHGGRYLTKGGTHKVLETTHWQPNRVAIIEFPDMTSERMAGSKLAMAVTGACHWWWGFAFRAGSA